MRVLVTGHQGFIGTHLLERLHETTDWMTVTLDGRDLSRYGDLPPADVVISLAAQVDVARSLREPSSTIANNVGIATTLVDYARRKITPPLIVHVTTAEVFGPGGPHGVCEPAKPTNPYAASKAAQDAIFTAAANAYGIPLASARTANVFGEHQTPDKFVPTVIRHLRAKQPVTLFGHAKRRWIHARDVADALIALAANGPTTANVTGSHLIDNAEIVHRIAHRLGVTPQLETITEQRPGHEDVYDIPPANMPITDDLDAGLDRVVAAAWA